MSQKGKKKGEFWKKAHFKYRISVINENTLEEVWKIKSSMFTGVILFLVVAFLLVTITSIIIITTPIRYYLPGYLDVEIREKSIRSAMKIDSLEQAVKSHDIYVENVRKILSGALEVDSVVKVDSVYISEDDPILEKSQREKEFITKYEEEEKYTLGVFPASAVSSGALFYKPIRGVVVEHFNANNKNYGIVIKVNKAETVQATLDGAVIFCTYDPSNNYIVHLQHANGYVSIYKGCTRLVKKVGDKIRTGEAIGVIEEKEEGKGGALVFELWNKGLPINPENYITF